MTWAQEASVEQQLRAELDALRAEQARIAEQQRQAAERMRDLEARLASAREAAKPSAPSDATLTDSRLKVSGDLRLRYQGDYSDEDLASRNSSQVRGRLGATYAATDRITVGARLVTGDPDDPNSTDVQLSNFADDLQVSLDLAYAQFNLGDLRLAGGKIPQPFVRTDLVWDSDVNPQGVSAVYSHGLGDGSVLRANGLFFVVDENAVAADSTMTGAQVGYETRALGPWKLDVHASYYDYRLGSVAGADEGDFRSNLRSPDGGYRSDFDLAELLVGVGWTGLGDRWPVRVLGDYVQNLGASTSADTGYGVDVSVGRVANPGEWRLTYGYSLAEADAVLAAFSHDNIGIGTDYKLHALTLDYAPWPKTVFSAIWYHYAPDDPLYAGANDPGDWLDRLRVAFTVGF